MPAAGELKDCLRLRVPEPLERAADAPLLPCKKLLSVPLLLPLRKPAPELPIPVDPPPKTCCNMSMFPPLLKEPEKDRDSNENPPPLVIFTLFSVLLTLTLPCLFICAETWLSCILKGFLLAPAAAKKGLPMRSSNGSGNMDCCCCRGWRTCFDWP